MAPELIDTWIRALPHVLQRGAVVVGVAYGLIIVAMFLLEPMLVFPAPRVSQAQLSRMAQAAGAQELTLSSEDGTALYGWRLGQGELLAVMFTGNGATVGGEPERYAWAASQGMAVLHVNYRGYPGSEGSPSESGLAMDARAMWQEALRTHPADKIVLVGKSLGGGVAVSLAAELGRAGGVQPRGLVVASSFTSAVDVARESYPWLPVGWLMRNRFESAAKAGDVRCPAVVLIS
jgi:hypothetical protein